MSRRAERAQQEPSTEPVEKPPPVEVDVPLSAPTTAQELEFLRTALHEGIEWARAADPSKLPAMVREYRATLMEITRLRADSGDTTEEVDEVDALIGDSSNVVRLPGADAR